MKLLRGYFAIGVIVVALAASAVILLRPVQPAEWSLYVSENPDYFFDRPGFFSSHGYTHFLSQLKFLLEDWRLKRNWRIATQKRFLLEKGDEIDQVQSALQHLSGSLLTQNQVHHEPLQTSGLATLVRGFGYCDQVNMSLALALEGVVPLVEVWALVDTVKNESPHTVVRLTGDFGILYADIWQPTSLFGFDDQVAEKFQKRVPLFSQVSGKLITIFQRPAQDVRSLYDNGYVLNRHDLAFQTKKLIARVFSGPIDLPAPSPISSGSSNPSHQETAPTELPSTQTMPKNSNKIEPNQEEYQSLRRKYLEARLQILLNQNPAPMALVKQNCQHFPHSTLECQAAQLFVR